MRILYVHNFPTRFVVIDHNLLSERYHVREWRVSSNRINVPATFQAVRQSDLVFAWFASRHSLLPILFARMLNKPSVVVTGGYDVANVPEAGYGLQRSGLGRGISRTVIHQANYLVANSQSARNEVIANTQADASKIKVIYHGIEASPEFPAGVRERLAITVGGVWRENLLRKGLLPFVQAAVYLPDVKFIHAGRFEDDAIEVLRKAAGPNVSFVGFVSNEQLEALYQRTAVYVQASLHEGFGMSLAEAMSAGCVPVATKAGSLPEVVGDTGIYIDSTRPEAIAAAVTEALQCNMAARYKARNRILTHFPVESRRQGLYQLIDSALAKVHEKEA